jgi:hypothetical protein
MHVGSGLRVLKCRLQPDAFVAVSAPTTTNRQSSSVFVRSQTIMEGEKPHMVVGVDLGMTCKWTAMRGKMERRLR